MKVAVIGSRDSGTFSVEDLIPYIPLNATELVSGGAKGIDALAEEAARILGLPITRFLPQYERYGRLAPLQRNREIVDYADCVLAFWDMHSHGTRDVIVQCVSRQKPVRVYRLEWLLQEHRKGFPDRTLWHGRAVE